jgi:hypothetical protein
MRNSIADVKNAKWKGARQADEFIEKNDSQSLGNNVLESRKK